VSIPVVFKDHTVGVLEFVSLPDEIFSEMEYINELKGALFVKSNTKKPSHIDGYALQYNSFEAIEILSELKKNSYRFEQLKHYEFGENRYAFYAFDIADFSGRSVAKAVFINDITKIDHKFNVDLVGIVVILVFLLIVLVATIHLGFKKIIERLDEALSESEKANKKLLHYVDLIDKNVITSTTNLQSTILSVSSAFCEISGYTKEELIGQNHRIVRHPDMPKSLSGDMWKTLSSDQVWQGEIKNKNKAGNYYWVFSTIYPIFNDAGKKIGYTAIRHDITDKKRVEELSVTDGLTAIYNRRYFDQIFPKFLNSVKRNNDFVCFYMIDVDYFKLYNDNYGHQAGDDVLVQIASVMRNSLRRSDDYCFRLGGEEFGILMRVSDEDAVCDFGEKLRLAVEALAIPHIGNLSSPYVTISIGQYCSFGVDIESREQLYKRSDDLLYQAKQEGRNQLRCSKQQ
jgi:diguanylate cyclase (GGDEF)-like protein/PAS domain S-box-containing protein